MAIFQSNAGGAWDNAKKMIESDGRKGLMRTKPLWLGTQLEIHLKIPQGLHSISF